jgi:hypothetical protein
LHAGGIELSTKVLEISPLKPSRRGEFETKFILGTFSLVSSTLEFAPSLHSYPRPQYLGLSSTTIGSTMPCACLPNPLPS